MTQFSENKTNSLFINSLLSASVTMNKVLITSQFSMISWFWIKVITALSNAPLVTMDTVDYWGVITKLRTN